jgi:peptidoglycan/xylan/chitin deacetylase (PgdA/CDA1 family)
MGTYIHIKQLIQQLAAWGGRLQAPFVGLPAEPRVCILAYHRVAPIPFVDPEYDAWNVSPPVFARQMACLAREAHVIRLSEVPLFLHRPRQSTKPTVAVTFDDGYANTIIYALPWLVRYAIPATFFVVTGEIGSPLPMAFDRWSHHNSHRAHAALWRPATWPELDQAVASGLVAIGGHSHTHPAPAPGFVPRFVEEVGQCRQRLVTRYGDSVTSYAYPYGSTRLGFVSPAHVAAVQQAGFARAVTTDLGLATPNSDPYRLPRIEVLECDQPSVLRGKIKGALAPYALSGRLRRAQRSH